MSKSNRAVNAWIRNRGPAEPDPEHEAKATGPVARPSIDAGAGTSGRRVRQAPSMNSILRNGMRGSMRSRNGGSLRLENPELTGLVEQIDGEIFRVIFWIWAALAVQSGKGATR
jgi:hypothetical protein